MARAFGSEYFNIAPRGERGIPTSIFAALFYDGARDSKRHFYLRITMFWRNNQGEDIFEAGNYWSSTENSATNAWKQNFSSGSQNNNNKTNTNYIRCVKGCGYVLFKP